MPEDEIVLQLYKKYKKKQEKNIKVNFSYLYQCGRYICLAYYKKKKNKKDTPMGCLDQQVLPVDNFNELIEDLSQNARDILTYKFVHGMNFSKISRETNIPYSKVLKIYQKSIELLKREYISM